MSRLTPSQYARHRGCSKQYVSKLLQSGRIERGAEQGHATAQYNLGTVKGPKVTFPRVLQAVGQGTGYSGDRLVQVGRQRDRIEARALLVYLAREWSRLTVKDLGRRLHRDPSMVSRQYAGYVRNRNELWEKQVQAARRPPIVR